LPLLADLLRSDLLLYRGGVAPDCAVVVAEAKPSTVPSVYAEPSLGRVVGRGEQPAVFEALSSGRSAQRAGRMAQRGAPSVVEVFPVRLEGRTIATLAVETGLIEKERQRKKSIVYRRALAQLRGIVLRGELEGGGNISPMGEHDGPMVVSSEGEILYISSIAENLYRKLGYVESLLRRKVTDLRTDETVFFKALETGACVEQLVQEGQLSWVKKAIPITSGGHRTWWQRLLPTETELDGVVVVVHDITEERQKEQELKIKSAMIQEIHHRVKNNLQTIAALLRLQERRTSSPDVQSILRETINRILSIAVVHEFLSCDESSIVNIKELCQRIVTEVTRGILGPDKHFKFVLDGADIFLPAQQATSCALIINELLQNAVEHGYAGRSEGIICINLLDNGNDLTIAIADDGQGLAPDFSIARCSSLGLQIVQTLVREDLRGRFSLQDGDGVRAVVTFPKFKAIFNRSVKPLDRPEED